VKRKTFLAKAWELMKRVHFSVAAVALGAHLSVGLAVAAVSTKHFDVVGNNVPELISSMESQNLFDNGEPAWALTTPSWNFSYTFSTKNGLLKLETIKLSQEIIVQMPSWKGYKSGSKCLKTSWDKMYGQLDSHEKGHVKIAQEAFSKVEKALIESGKLIGEQSSEEALKAKIAEALAEAVKPHNTAQADYESNSPAIVFDQCP
jgi:predicted secreted Zn-dependent protease